MTQKLGATITEFTPEKMDEIRLISPYRAQTITLRNENGKEAVIDFSGDEVTFGGDLPLNHAAKLFFYHVGHLLRGDS